MKLNQMRKDKERLRHAFKDAQKARRRCENPYAALAGDGHRMIRRCRREDDDAHSYPLKQGRTSDYLHSDCNGR